MTWALGPEVVATDVDDGMVLLDQRDGRYWQLNRTGATALRLLLDGTSPQAAADRLTRNSPSAAERARGDVQALLDALLKARLVVRR